MIIGKRDFVRTGDWWSSATCRTNMCHNDFVDVFDVPEDVKQVTVTLYTKPGPQRVKLRYVRNPDCTGHGRLDVVDKESPRGWDDDSYCVEIQDDEVSEVVGSKRVFFYAQVIYEE